MVPQRPMRIGINALYLLPGAVGGSEIYVRALIAALARVDRHNEYFIFRNRETGADLVPAQANFVDRPQNLRAASRPARILYEQTVFLAEVARCRLDLLLNTGVTAPLACRVPMATVVYDVQYRVHPEYVRWFEWPIWHTLLPLSARRSRKIVTISAASMRQIAQYYPWSEDRLVLVTPGVERDFEAVAERRAASPARDEMILTVSTLHPHKNLDTLIEAFALLAQRRTQLELIVCGLKGFETERLVALRDRLGLEHRIVFTGWIERSKLLDYFAKARAFVYPSRFEGFGIPVLEALTAGVPIVCSDIPPLHEIAAEHATYVDPDDHRALAAALEATLDAGERQERMNAGRARAALFSWDANAASLRRTLESVVRPSISVVVPSLNQGHFLGSTLDSILAQGVGGLEIIVVDGGSNDDTLGVLRRYGNTISWTSEPDRGQSDAINKGLARARGEIVCYLNSDDVLEPGALAFVQRHFAENPQNDWVFGRCRIIDADGSPVRSLVETYKRSWAKVWRTRTSLLVLNYVPQPATFWRARAMRAVGPIDESLYYAMDYDFWLRLAAKSAPAYIDRYLASFRIHASSKSLGDARSQLAEAAAVARRRGGGMLDALHRAHDWATLATYRSRYGQTVTRRGAL